MVPIEVSQGYLGTELETVLVRLGQSPVLKTPTREGYTFAGWYVDGDEFDTNTIISEDDYGLYVYAEWEENVKPDEPEVPAQPQQNKYTLRVKEVDAEGNSIAFLEVFEDLTVEELNAKTDAYPNDEYEIVNTVISDNGFTVTLIVRAVEEQPEEPEVPVEEFTLNFVAEEGTIYGESSYTIKAKKGETIIIPDAAVREGYEFDYWEGSVYYSVDEYVVTGDHTLVAKWKTSEEPEQPEQPEVPGETDKETPEQPNVPGETDKETPKEPKVPS